MPSSTSAASGGAVKRLFGGSMRRLSAACTRATSGPWDPARRNRMGPLLLREVVYGMAVLPLHGSHGKDGSGSVATRAGAHNFFGRNAAGQGNQSRGAVCTRGSAGTLERFAF